MSVHGKTTITARASDRANIRAKYSKIDQLTTLEILPGMTADQRSSLTVAIALRSDQLSDLIGELQVALDAARADYGAIGNDTLEARPVLPERLAHLAHLVAAS